jgi:hypothetical protein
VSNADLRIFGAAIALALWLTLLFTGWVLGGFVHALLVAGILLVPWRALPKSTAEVVEGSEQAVGKGRDS